MRLADYKKLDGRSWREIADDWGVAWSILAALAQGSRECSLPTTRIIEDKSNGAVTANDLNDARREWLDKNTPKPARASCED